MIMSSYLNGGWDKHLGRIVVMGNVWVRWSFPVQLIDSNLKNRNISTSGYNYSVSLKAPVLEPAGNVPTSCPKNIYFFPLLLLTLLLIFTTKEMSRCTLQNCERWTALGNVKMYLEPFFWNKCLLTGENPFNSHECALNTELELGGN